jgi:hypothetical protein
LNVTYVDENSQYSVNPFNLEKGQTAYVDQAGVDGTLDLVNQVANSSSFNITSFTKNKLGDDLIISSSFRLN